MTESSLSVSLASYAKHLWGFESDASSQVYSEYDTAFAKSTASQLYKMGKESLELTSDFILINPASINCLSPQQFPGLLKNKDLSNPSLDSYQSCIDSRTKNKFLKTCLRSFKSDDFKSETSDQESRSTFIFLPIISALNSMSELWVKNVYSSAPFLLLLIAIYRFCDFGQF